MKLAHIGMHFPKGAQMHHFGSFCYTPIGPSVGFLQTSVAGLAMQSQPSETKRHLGFMKER